MEVKKAIIPAAGLGTRFLPATKAIPKEMVPLVDKPAIQYIVEEGVKSGINNFIMVTSKYKNEIADHFDTITELDSALKSKNRESLLSSTAKIMEQAEFSYVRQREALGLGHAIWSARHCIGKEHVAVLLPDDIVVGPNPAMAQLIRVAQQEKCNVVAVQEVPMEMTSRYGIVDIKKQFSPNLFQVRELVEKPSMADAPSNLAIIGRYVLSPNIFPMLEETANGALGEVQLTDGIQRLLLSGEKVFAFKLQGTRYDTGTPMGWMKANIALALRHGTYGEEMETFLKDLDKDMILMEGKAEHLGRKVA